MTERGIVFQKAFQTELKDWKITDYLGEIDGDAVYLASRKSFGNTEWAAIRHFPIPRDQKEMEEIKKRFGTWDMVTLSARVEEHKSELVEQHLGFRNSGASGNRPEVITVPKGGLQGFDILAFFSLPNFIYSGGVLDDAAKERILHACESEEKKDPSDIPVWSLEGETERLRAMQESRDRQIKAGEEMRIKKEQEQEARKRRKKRIVILTVVLVSLAAAVAGGIVIAGNIRRDNTYNEAVQAYQEDRTEEAQALFETVRDYKDSAGYMEKIAARREMEASFAEAQGHFDREEYEEAKEIYDSLSRNHFPGAEEKALETQDRIDFIEAEALMSEGLAELLKSGSTDKLKRAEEILDKLKDRMDKAAEPLDRIRENLGKEEAYRAAEQEGLRKNYEAAAKNFSDLGDYRDSGARSETMRTYATFQRAKNDFSSGNYREALEVLEALGDFENADTGEKAETLAEKAREAIRKEENDAIREEAVLLEKQGKYTEALEKYGKLDEITYLEAQERVEKKYQEAVGEFQRAQGKEDLKRAEKLLEAMGGYGESEKYLTECRERIRAAERTISVSAESFQDHLTISWTDNEEGHHYVLTYRMKGSAASVSIVDGVSPVELTGLLPGTEYEIGVADSAGPGFVGSITAATLTAPPYSRGNIRLIRCEVVGIDNSPALGGMRPAEIINRFPDLVCRNEEGHFTADELGRYTLYLSIACSNLTEEAVAVPVRILLRSGLSGAVLSESESITLPAGNDPRLICLELTDDIRMLRGDNAGPDDFLVELYADDELLCTDSFSVI